MSNGSDEAKFIIFSFFIAIIYGLVKLIKKLFGLIDGGKAEGKKKKEGQTGRPFFVKSLTRRRRLDLTRKDDNIMSGKLGKKMDRHRRGMFGK